MFSLNATCTGPSLVGESLPADFYTSDDNLLILVDLPGVSPDNIELSTQDGRLVIEGTRKEAEETPSWRRVFRLSDRYDVSHIVASASRGILSVTIPKRAEAKKVRIPVTVA